MQLKTGSHHRFLSALISAILVVGLALVISDWKDISSVLAQADWRYIIPVVLFTFLSYAFYSYAYAYIAKMLGIPMGKVELAEVCFISTVINHVLTTGGVVGYSLRFLLMRLYNVSLKDVLSSSFLHYYLTSLDMLTILPLSFFYVLVHAAVPRAAAIALGFMIVFFGLVLVLSTLLVLFPSKRRPLIRGLAFIGQKILRRDLATWLSQLDESLNLGTDAIRQSPLRLVWIMLLTLLDFCCSIIAMGFVFFALGSPVKPEVLVCGYVIGIMAGLISMIPGGLGIQEGSMAWIYTLLGVRLEQAALAAILFRILYYLLPYFLILPFYKRLLLREKTQVALEP